MNISNIFDRIIIKCGQYLMTKANIELDENRFLVLVEDALELYNKYCPLDFHFHLEMPNNGAYEFTSESQPYGIPEFIVDAKPVGASNQFTYLMRSGHMMNPANRQASYYLDQKLNTPFEYRKPVLSTAYSGRHDVHAAFHYYVKTETDEQTGVITNSIPNITIKETYFFELLRGAFLQGIGRSRRSFTIEALPITMDAEQIIAEGAEIHANAVENIINNQSKFWLAYGG